MTWPSRPRLKRIVLVATSCQTCGQVVVAAQGSPSIVGAPFKLGPIRWQKTIDLKSATMKKRQLITVKTYANPSSNTFQGWLLRIYPKSGHPRIEGLALVSG